MTELMPAEPEDDESEAMGAGPPYSAEQPGRFLRWPTGLVIGILIVHSILVHGAGADPWRLGGFGMFSSPYTRVVETTLVDAEGRAIRVLQSDLWARLAFG